MALLLYPFSCSRRKNFRNFSNEGCMEVFYHGEGIKNSEVLATSEFWLRGFEAYRMDSAILISSSNDMAWEEIR